MATAATTSVFRLPDLGEGLTEAELVQWLVQVGDTIRIDQAIAEVETAKSIVELPSPFAGTIAVLHGSPGDTIAVGTPVLEVDSGARPDDSDAPAPSAPPPAEISVELEAHRDEERAGSGNVLIGYGTSAEHGPARRRARLKAGKRPGVAPAQHPRPPIAAVAPAATAAASELAKASPARQTVPVRSPLLRRLARDLGVDVRAMTPSGADGAITRGDILRAASATEQPVATLSTRDPELPQAVPGDLPPETGRERMSMLRRAVSAKMTRSRSEIPEATVWVDVDATQLWELRGQMTRGDQRPPSLTALIARFTLLALTEYPLLASCLSDDGQEIIRYQGVNLGIAADTERGLVVPVIPGADRLPIGDLDQQLRAVASSARNGELPPERLRGSTFTLNNYGSLGVDGSAAIINHPEVAILGVGRLIERPWVVDGKIVPRRIVQLSLVFDHRICDGGYAASFINHVVTSIEQPLSVYSRL